MDNEQALENNGPGLVSKAVLERSKDLGDASFASMCGY
jgi:hypothetical protein